jgi:hypothetical protein
MARARKILTKERIQLAHKMTMSNLAASRYLHVSYPHYRAYAKSFKNDEGKTLFDAHKNQNGRGIPKFLKGTGKQPALLDLMEGRIPVEHFDPQKIKHRMVYEGLLEENCNKCKFSEKRVTDLRVPLVLNFKDNNRKNYSLENIEMLCYNCSFLYGISPITAEQVEAMENYIENPKKEFDWELDEYQLEHLKTLGLYEEEKPGEEYISRL